MRQRKMVVAYTEKDYAEVNRLQTSIINSRAGRVVARMNVRSNKGGKTPGVDGVVVSTDKEKLEVIEWMKKMVETPRKYKPFPLKTIMIPKPGSSETRKLRIPTVKDRMLQARYVLATDPVVECTSDRISFGFRKNRSAGDAVQRRRRIYSGNYGVPGAFRVTDVAKCFDSISHKFRIENVPNQGHKVRLEKWLRAGSRVDGMVEESDVGTPQGGVVSPILANVALNGMEQHLQRAGFSAKDRVHRIRYADDLVITAKDVETAERIKPVVAEFLEVRGRRMKESKTRIDVIEKGRDFLGWNLILRERDYRSAGSKNSNKVLAMQPSKTSRRRAKKRIGEGTNKKRQTMREVVEYRNPRRKGWCNYFRSTSHSTKTLAHLDAYLYQKMVRWEQRVHTGEGKKALLNRRGGKWLWKTEEGVERYRPIVDRGGYPSFPTRNARKAQLMWNPYVKEGKSL